MEKDGWQQPINRCLYQPVELVIMAGNVAEFRVAIRSSRSRPVKSLDFPYW